MLWPILFKHNRPQGFFKLLNGELQIFEVLIAPLTERVFQSGSDVLIEILHEFMNLFWVDRRALESGNNTKAMVIKA